MMDVNIGVRLHSLVFSAVMNVPTIGISYDPKIDGFLDMIDLNPVCTYEKIVVDKIVEEVGKMLELENVDYSEKIKSFKEAGIETLNKIILEIEK